MCYIVLDMEWNQPFNYRKMIRKPVKLVGEIVQIGAVKLSEAFEMVDTFKIMVAPKYYTRMNEAVEDLTHITTSDLQYGFPFPQAIKHFINWCGSDYSFITWGWDDVDMLEDNLKLHGLDYSWLPTYYNLQPIYNYQISKESRQASLSEAMGRLNLEMSEAHDALNDARNAAKICTVLDVTAGIEAYGEIIKRPLKKTNATLDEISSRKSYKDRQDVFVDLEMNRFICNGCGEMVCCGEWLKQSTDKYVCIARCDCGEEFFVRLRFRKNNNGTWRAGITVYAMNEEHQAFYNGVIERNKVKEEKWIAYQQLHAVAV